MGEEGNGGDPETVAAVFLRRTRRARRVSIFGNVATARSAQGAFVRAARALALFFSQGKQNQENAERSRNRRGGEPDSRDFGAEMKTFLQLCSKTDQKEKKAQVEQN